MAQEMLELRVKIAKNDAPEKDFERVTADSSYPL
jgi:hypothetical protein